MAYLHFTRSIGYDDRLSGRIVSVDDPSDGGPACRLRWIGVEGRKVTHRSQDSSKGGETRRALGSCHATYVD
jgi:hypothetical protein